MFDSFKPVDSSLPGSSVHGILQSRILEWVAISLLQEIFLTQGSNLDLLHCSQIIYCLSHQGSSQVTLMPHYFILPISDY